MIRILHAACREKIELPDDRAYNVSEAMEAHEKQCAGWSQGKWITDRINTEIDLTFMRPMSIRELAFAFDWASPSHDIIARFEIPMSEWTVDEFVAGMSPQKKRWLSDAILNADVVVFTVEQLFEALKDTPKDSSILWIDMKSEDQFVPERIRHEYQRRKKAFQNYMIRPPRYEPS